MADEIIKVLEYILNNETLITVGTAYFVIAFLCIGVFLIVLKAF